MAIKGKQKAKFGIGDKVRIKRFDERPWHWAVDGKMNKWMGKVVTIRGIIFIDDSLCRSGYFIEEDKEENCGKGWLWDESDLEPVEFDWDAFKDTSNKIAVHCKTEEEAKDFCKQMHEHGMKWSAGASYLDFTNFEFVAKETCYEGNGTYGSYRCLKNANYTILEYEDYFTKEKEKQKLLIPKKCRRVLKQINKEYKWIAKDRNGQVYVYENKPFKRENKWFATKQHTLLSAAFKESLFDWLSWEDEEPVNFRENFERKKRN